MGNWPDRYIDFFINNYDDIKELIKLAEYVKGRLPRMLDSDMKDCIYKLKNENEKIRVGSYKSDIWWFDTDEYDEKKGGAYFSYEPAWDRLYSDDDSTDAAYFYLHVSAGNLDKKAEKNKYIDDLISDLRNKLKEKSDIHTPDGIRFISNIDYDDEDGPAILKYTIRKEEIMAIIADRPELRDKMQRAVSDFTETIRSILKPI